MVPERFKAEYAKWTSLNGLRDALRWMQTAFVSTTFSIKPDLWKEVIPTIQKLALRLPSVVPPQFDVLESGHCSSVKLSAAACLSLLANAFFCNQIDYADQVCLMRLFALNLLGTVLR